MEAFEKVQQLKTQLDTFRPLKPEAEARIMQKFRLDWNYHSNNIEGNSLTYGETKAFILFGITAGKKPFKDYLEIKGHNEAINWVLSLVKGETELTEVFIRELHTLLLKESSESFAQTPDGKPTTKKIEVGKYKTLPNHVLTATNEMFYFASPEETPAKMQELIDWYRAEREKSDVNPIILATLFHYRFIRIHPFDDGNGRTARILMNFILMQNGFPPVIIKTEDKENYYGVLRLADVGELEPFIEYIANNLIHSLEIMIRGAKGESIEEADDLDKELAMFERRIISLRDKNEKPILDTNTMLTVFDKSIFPLVNKFIESCEKFGKLYKEHYLRVFFEGIELKSKHKTATEILTNAREKINTLNFGELKILVFSYNFNYLKNSSIGKLGFVLSISIKFELSEFIVVFKKMKKESIFKKAYSETLSQKEIDEIVNNTIELHKEIIDKQIEQMEKMSKKSSP